jgi:hypothetical protein
MDVLTVVLGPTNNQTNQTTDQNNGQKDGQNTELIVAISALCISVVALIAALLQMMQVYFASAAGYSNCNKKVMGDWHQSKKRILRSTEFRFEVQFETPVIFLCPPANRNGPVKGQKIRFLDGTAQSLVDTWTTLQGDKKEEEQKTEKERIHTADNDRSCSSLWASPFHPLDR